MAAVRKKSRWTERFFGKSGQAKPLWTDDHRAAWTYWRASQDKWKFKDTEAAKDGGSWEEGRRALHIGVRGSQENGSGGQRSPHTAGGVAKGMITIGQYGWLSGKGSACNAGDAVFNSWVRKIPWKRAWQPTPAFLPGEIPWMEEPGKL